MKNQPKQSKQTLGARMREIANRVEKRCEAERKRRRERDEAARMKFLRKRVPGMTEGICEHLRLLISEASEEGGRELRAYTLPLNKRTQAAIERVRIRMGEEEVTLEWQKGRPSYGIGDCVDEVICVTLRW